MPMYTNIGGGSKKLASLYINNNGTSKKLNYAYANINGSKKEIYPAQKYKMTYKSYTSYTYEYTSNGPAELTYGWNGHVYKSYSFSNSRFYLSGDITDKLEVYDTDSNGNDLYDIPDNVNNGIGYFYWESMNTVIAQVWCAFGIGSNSTIKGWHFYYRIPTSISSIISTEYSKYPTYPNYSYTDSNGYKYNYVTGSTTDDTGEYSTCNVYKDYGDRMYLTCEEM